MENIVEELIEVIAREVDAFNGLLQTLHDRQRAIVEGQFDRVDLTVADENRIAGETRTLQAERVERSHKVAEYLEMENLNPKFGELIDKVEKRYAERLRAQRDLLCNLFERIQNMNENNQFLLNHSLNVLEENMELLFASNASLKKDDKVKKGPDTSKVPDHIVRIAGDG